MSRRTIPTTDVVELACQRAAGVSLRRIARELGMSRTTARKYLVRLVGCGLTIEPGLTPAEVGKLLTERCPWLTDRSCGSRLSRELRVLDPEIVLALSSKTTSQVYRWLRQNGRFDGSMSTFRRYVRRTMPRSTSPSGPAMGQILDAQWVNKMINA